MFKASEKFKIIKNSAYEDSVSIFYWLKHMPSLFPCF